MIAALDGAQLGLAIFPPPPPPRPAVPLALPVPPPVRRRIPGEHAAGEEGHPPDQDQENHRSALLPRWQDSLKNRQGSMQKRGIASAGNALQCD
jgi:hypothetical protein